MKLNLKKDKKPWRSTSKTSLGVKLYEPYLWLMPSLLVLAGMILYPWIWTFFVSLQKWNPLMQSTPVFNGLQNYFQVVTDPNFIRAIQLTIILTAGTVGLQFLIGFGLALLLNTDIKGKSVFRTLLLIPMMLTPSVVGMLWKLILQDEFGIANWVMIQLGLPKLGWLSDPALTMPIIIAIQTWLHMPFVLLMLSAGLQSIPNELMEAAKVDGANYFQTLYSVVIPWLKPVIILILFFRTMFALRTFDTIYGIWASSGPLKSGMVLGAYLFEQTRVMWQFGTGATVSYLMLFITLTITIWPIIKIYRGEKR